MKGYDSAVDARENDHLKRWPFAQEIFGIIKTCPTDWSVRVGIYGQWGTGKTSVMNFIRKIALDEGFLVFNFNPWEFHSRQEMWNAFVPGIINTFEEKIPKLVRSDKIRSKIRGEWMVNNLGLPLTKIYSVLNETSANLAEKGFEHLKKLCNSNVHDLDKIQKLKDKPRLIVLIDDLDRANSDLLPDLFYALKEILDVPGLAFVCAFDPNKVGFVLAKHHPSLNDGLHFLEKIIDYPLWLPEPSQSDIHAFISSQLSEYTPEVPLFGIKHLIPTLPRNPRLVKQFVRLLALLRPCITRHYDLELHWPAIFLSNVLKVSYSEISHILLRDDLLWSELHSRALIGFASEDNKQPVLEFLENYLNKLANRFPVLKEGSGDRVYIKKLLLDLTDIDTPFSGLRGPLTYQLRVAESPHALTWKEFDLFFNKWRESSRSFDIRAWLKEHADKVGQTASDVFSELFEACLDKYDLILGESIGEISHGKMQKGIKECNLILKLMEQLIAILPKVLGHGNIAEQELINHLFGTLGKHGKSGTLSNYANIRTHELKIVGAVPLNMKSDPSILINMLKEQMAEIGHDYCEPMKQLHQDILQTLSQRISQQIIDRMEEPGFISDLKGDRSELRKVLFDLNAPLWTTFRKAFLNKLARAVANEDIHLNAVNLMIWMINSSRDPNNYGEDPKELLTDNDICVSLWNAVCKRSINPRFIRGLQSFPSDLEKRGITIQYPHWWKRSEQETKPSTHSPTHN